MFRIITLENGSFDVLEPQTGRRLCSIPQTNQVPSNSSLNENGVKDHNDSRSYRGSSPGSEYSKCSSHEEDEFSYENGSEYIESEYSEFNSGWHFKNYLKSTKPQIKRVTDSSEQILLNLPPDEPESDCIDNYSFFKYLNLIPSKNTMDRNDLQEWPVRSIARIIKDEQPLSYVRLYTKKPIKVSNTCKDPSKEQIDIKNWLQEELNNQQQNLEIVNPNSIKTFLMKCLNKIEFSSPLGLKISFELTKLDYKDIDNKIRAIEASCNCEETYKDNDSCDIGYVKPNSRQCNVIRSQRSNSPSSISSTTKVTRSGNKRSKECHMYSFNKQQKLLRLEYIETHLNVKGRIKSWLCKPVTVNLHLLTECPQCGNKLLNSHQCTTETQANANINTNDNIELIDISEEEFELEHPSFDIQLLRTQDT